MGQEHDPELQDYLRGGSDISRAYRRLKPATPPDEIDQRLLEAARQQTADLPALRKLSPEARRPPWFAPFALAATVLLSVALVLAVVFAPSKPRSDDETHWVYAAARKTDRLRLRVESVAAAPRRFDAQAQPRDPQSWLMRIRELRREGRHLEAEAEYRRFRSAFPSYAGSDEPEDDAPQ